MKYALEKLIEAESPDEMITRWERAITSYEELERLHAERDKVFRKLGVALRVNRQLAPYGYNDRDIGRLIRGKSVQVSDNYQGERKAKVCNNPECQSKFRPFHRNSVECPHCGHPLEDGMVPVRFSELRSTFAEYYVGAEMKDGKKVWFKTPVAP